MGSANIANLIASSQEAGDKTPLHVHVVDASGVAVAFGGAGGTSETDGAPYTQDVTAGTPVMGVFDSTPDTLTDGDLGIIALDEDRNVKVNIVAGAAGGTQYTEGDTDASIVGNAAMMEVAADTLAPVQGTVADGLLVNLGANNDVALAAGTNTNEVVGDAAHDAAIAGNPLRLAGRALTADYTAVAAGDTADLITTLLGKLVTIPYANPANTWGYAAASGGIVNTTEVTAKAAGGAGVRNYVTSAQIINGHATVSTEIVIRDGTAGTVLWRGHAQALGGGAAFKFDPPLRGTADTLISVGAITTGSAVYVNLQGFVAAE